MKTVIGTFIWKEMKFEVWRWNFIVQTKYDDDLHSQEKSHEKKSNDSFPVKTKNNKWLSDAASIKRTISGAGKVSHKYNTHIIDDIVFLQLQLFMEYCTKKRLEIKLPQKPKTFFQIVWY